jgi:aminoglycoside/choline kinase family phosphotransferase
MSSRRKTGSERSSRRPVSTRDQWAEKAVHTATLHSGAVVTIRIPDLPTLMLAGALPERLRGAALEVLNREVKREAQVAAALAGGGVDVPDLTEDDLNELTKLRIWLAAEMVVEPEVTEADFQQDGPLPKEDAALLAAIAIRERDTDALGVRLGVAELSAYDRFLLVHECSPGCKACEAKRDEAAAAGGVAL